MARISEMHKKWLKEPKYRKAYDALEEEFVLASAVIDVRNRAALTQEELARKMGTTQPVVARLESGRSRPSMRTLERLVDATGSRPLISVAPRTPKKPHSGICEVLRETPKPAAQLSKVFCAGTQCRQPPAALAE